jgi:hypothetical protein
MTAIMPQSNPGRNAPLLDSMPRSGLCWFIRYQSMRYQIRAAACSLATAFLALAASQPAGIDKIAAYKGTWKVETEYFATAHSKARKEFRTLENACWHSSRYYVCDQLVDGLSQAIIVYTYDEQKDEYTTYPIPPNGGPPRTGKLIIKDNVWTFPWEEEKAGKTTYYQVVNVFTAPRTIEYRQEFSDDKAHWTVMAKGIERKK